MSLLSSPMPHPLSLTARVSLLFGIGVTVVLFSLGWLVAWSVDRHFLEIDRHELEGKLALVANLLAKVDSPEAMDAVPKELDDALVGHAGLSVTLVDARGNKWFASRDLDYPAGLFRPPQVHGLATWREGDRGYRGLKAPVTSGDGRAFTAAIVLDISHHLHFIDTFKQGLAVAMTLAALLSAGLGWLAVHTGLRPLRRMTDLAAGLSASHLDARLPEADFPPEIRSLATAFNAMLDRLEDSFRRLSEFSADIAHELRTPVSNLLTQAQVALSRARSAPEYREVLQSSTEEYERLAHMIGDMLFLAKADNRLLALDREDIDLATEAGGLVEFHGILAEERDIRLEVAGSANTEGDRLMLRRALSNLLSNAIRHSPAGGTVTIRLGGDAAGAVIAVENPGEIPAEQLPRLFDRFYTGDPARRAGGEGAGLGLAIVRSIVELHGGEISVVSNGGVTRFVMRLPHLTQIFH
ncbi:heavy metal sensor histidine kinase [Stenotrophomonas sp.]|uniref:heavy metal sensor histidine kinase n=1 Tax=Stenotrophomonas sp. TaxID=69392 RepID=UPI0025D94839|nr:heavy metal sensor histidine kinase [Stenotrophomonas sp.]